MKRFLAVVAWLVIGCNFAPNLNAQVVFKGPDSTKVNKMTTITLDKVDGDDLKLQGFYNGKPSDSSDFLLMKNFSDQVVIFLMTEKVGTFTFIGAVNKSGKTLVSNFTIDVVGSTPPPDPTPPTPKVTTFGDKLKSLYKVSPDTASLNKLLAILDEVSGQDYKSFDDMEAVLAKTGAKFLPNNELRSIRDAITAEIMTRCGDDPRRRDVDKVKAIYKEASTALKGV